ncbi:MAG: nucleotidyltransferase domain-containing protein [Thermodesulfobacteriota bacterium]|nr:MAG: nucleotidyltransferase domain-containing protein [Thermodesulfobacteriota bacterium]
MLSISDIKERLAPLFDADGLSLIILFGSMASGAVHARSDVDLAFLYDDKVDILELTNRTSALLGINRVDLVDLRLADPLLKFAIAKTGKIVYERSPGEFSEFYSLAFRRYVDTKKLRDAQEGSVRMFLAERGLS